MEVGERRMRVIAGEWRGRTLTAPRGHRTRPTSDRVREAMFSTAYSLIGDLDGARVLDLYAGSGALGIEALSRGASHVTFVEDDPRAVRAIRTNLRSLDVPSSRFTVHRSDVARFHSASRIEPVSLLFADPPYTIDPAEEWQVLEALGAAGSLEKGCLVVYEHGPGVEAAPPETFALHACKRYGDTAVSFATYKG